MAFVGVLQIGIPYALLFAAQQWVPSAFAAVLFATFPVWLALVARLLLRDHPLTPRKIAAALLGVGGVVLLELPALRGQTLSPLAAAGGALVLMASVVVAFANVFVRRELGGSPPVVIAFVQVVTGALVLVCSRWRWSEGGRSAARQYAIAIVSSPSSAPPSPTCSSSG